MTVLKSFTHKIFFAFCFLLAVISILLYIDLSKDYHVNSEALRIKLASQLGFRAYEMGWLAQRITEREIVAMEEVKRKELVVRLKGEIASFDRVLKDIKNGSSKDGLEKLTYRDGLLLVDNIYGDWADSMKPALVQLSAMPSSISEKEARNILTSFDDGLTQLTNEADMLVSFLNDDYLREIRAYRRFRLYIFAFFLASAFLLLFYVTKRIVRPLQSLHNAAKQIANKNYDVHVDLKQRDEIGDLGQAFNLMAAEIAGAMGEILWHSEDIMALNRSLNTFVGLQKEEDLYKAVCEHACGLFGLRSSLLGLLNEDDRNVRIVASSGFEDGYIACARITWDDSESGLGPEGTAIKTNLPQIINDIESADVFPAWREETRRLGFRSCMVQPLICANCAVIGVLVFYGAEKDHFTPNMSDLCQIFSGHAASVIENVILLKDLEGRVEERTEKLRDALLLAESANRAKSDFLANMSHDLRTPLNAIIGFSEALSQGIYGELKDEHREYITYIYQSGIKLFKLINEVLELSKMETGAMELEYVDCRFSDLLNSALYIFREKIKKHGIEVSTEVSPDAETLVVDSNKIKQVMVNLLTDAIRATPDRGRITIKAEAVPFATIAAESCSPGEAAAGDRSCIEVSVTDTRPGLSSEDRLRFFEPYKQFDAALGRKQDSISLILSKRFIEMHGGRIWAEAPAGPQQDGDRTEGNRFIFILPQVPCRDTLSKKAAETIITLPGDGA